MRDNIIISSPKELVPALLSQVIRHITAGAQVEKDFVKRGVARAQLIGVMLSGDAIVSTAVLKRPLATYTYKVFKKAGIGALAFRYEHELGYFVTNTAFEGKGCCQILLKELLPQIMKLNFFATTRKPSMMHILKKFGMISAGKTYDEDLNLLISILEK